MNIEIHANTIKRFKALRFSENYARLVQCVRPAVSSLWSGRSFFARWVAVAPGRSASPGLEALGAKIDMSDGYVRASAPNGLKGGRSYSILRLSAELST